jgi:hypothetical protein
MASCSGHGGSHKGAKPAKKAKKAKVSCSVKLKQKKKDNKQMAAFIKKLRAK